MAKWKKIFIDSAVAPIIAWDFDGCINVDGEDEYPDCGSLRPYTKKVMNLLHDCGVKNVIWTSRDTAYNQEDNRIYDHTTPMVKFLNENGIKYDAINKSVQFAPYSYNGRKIYAHLYVDDRGYGWKESSTIMIDIFSYFLIHILDMEPDVVKGYVSILKYRSNMCNEYVYMCKNIEKYVKEWKS